MTVDKSNINKLRQQDGQGLGRPRNTQCRIAVHSKLLMKS